MEDAFFSSGVPLGRLKELLGEPLSPGQDDAVSVRITRIVAGVEREVSATGKESFVWDCLGYESAFRAILAAASHASDSERDAVLELLSAASRVHILSQCRAERIVEDLWVVQQPCVKHLWERRS